MVTLKLKEALSPKACSVMGSQAQQKPQGPCRAWLAGHLKGGMPSAVGLLHGRGRLVLLGTGAQGWQWQSCILL